MSMKHHSREGFSKLGSWSALGFSDLLIESVGRPVLASLCLMVMKKRRWVTERIFYLEGVLTILCVNIFSRRRLGPMGYRDIFT